MRATICIALLALPLMGAKPPKTYDLTVRVVESGTIQKVPSVAHGSTDCTPDTNGGMDCNTSTPMGYEAAQAVAIIQNMQYQLECAPKSSPLAYYGPTALWAGRHRGNGCLLTPGDYEGRWDKSILAVRVKLPDGKWKEVPFRVIGIKKAPP